MHASNRDLRRYWHSEVQLDSADTEQVKEVVMTLIHHILHQVSSFNPIFQSTPKATGSFPVKLKVRAPDEFDFEIPVLLYSAVQPELHWFKQKYSTGERYYTVKNPYRPWITRSNEALEKPPLGYCHLTIEDDYDDMDRAVVWDDDVVPCLVRRSFRKALNAAVDTLGLRDWRVEIASKDHGPTTKIKIFDNGDLPFDQVSIDLVPTFHLGTPIPPNSTWLGWPRKGTKWPKKAIKQELMENGVNFVPKMDLYWYVSFADAEDMLAAKMDQDGGCRKQVHRIMKMLNITQWSQCDEPEELTSYALKNLLYWECEEYWRSQDWQQDCLEDRFHSTMNRLLQCLADRNIPQYFCPKINLLKNRNAQSLDWIESNIREFLDDPGDVLNV